MNNSLGVLITLIIRVRDDDDDDDDNVKCKIIQF